MGFYFITLKIDKKKSLLVNMHCASNTYYLAEDVFVAFEENTTKISL